MRSALSEDQQFPQFPAPVAIHPAPVPEHAHHPWLQHHFDNMEQQAEASTLGMWVFLVTEIMFFGGLFMAYLVYRHASPQGFQEASHHLNIYWGAANTAILIISSLTMALAVRAGALICADLTARAIVSELTMRTIVFTAPHVTFR